DGRERAGEARREEAPTQPRERDELEGHDADRQQDRRAVVRNQKRQRVENAADERSHPRDRTAHERVSATRELAGVREARGKGHADPRADGGGDARNERVEGLVRVQRDREDRREGRERPVDQPGHRRLDTLKKEGLLVGHSYSVSNQEQVALS